MSDKLKNRFEKVQQLLGQLVLKASRGALIVVEGQNDLKALKELAIKGKTVTVKTAGKSFLDVVAEIEKQNASEVILLLDFDRRGREWTKRLRQRLEEKKMKVDVHFWKMLRALIGHDIKDVESFPTYLKTLKKQIGN